MTATLMRALSIEHSSIPQSTVHYADERGHVFIVADGMGGAAGGEKASALALGAVEEFLLNALRWLFALDGTGDASVLREFQSALRSADAYVCAAAAHDPGLRGMGTTLTMAYSLGADLFWLTSETVAATSSAAGPRCTGSRATTPSCRRCRNRAVDQGGCERARATSRDYQRCRRPQAWNRCGAAPATPGARRRASPLHGRSDWHAHGRPHHEPAEGVAKPASSVRKAHPPRERKGWR